MPIDLWGNECITLDVTGAFVRVYDASFIVHRVASTDVLRSKIAYEPWTVLRIQVLGFRVDLARGD